MKWFLITVVAIWKTNTCGEKQLYLIPLRWRALFFPVTVRREIWEFPWRGENNKHSLNYWEINRTPNGLHHYVTLNPGVSAAWMLRTPLIVQFLERIQYIYEVNQRQKALQSTRDQENGFLGLGRRALQKSFENLERVTNVVLVTVGNVVQPSVSHSSEVIQWNTKQSWFVTCPVPAIEKAVLLLVGWLAPSERQKRQGMGLQCADAVESQDRVRPEDLVTWLCRCNFLLLMTASNPLVLLVILRAASCWYQCLCVHTVTSSTLTDGLAVHFVLA